MKKLILLSAILITSFAFSQKFEISVGYGAPSIYGISNDLGTGLVSTITKDGSPNSIGALNVSALVYNKNEKWRYGLDFVSEFFSVSDTNYSKKSTISIMPRVDYFWSGEGKKLKLYSGVSAGIYLDNAMIKNSAEQEEKLNDSTFGFNITPIGLRYGSALAVFVEPNIGVKGIGQAGISYRF